MKWIARACPKTDRMACPWLIAWFIDTTLEFVLIPADQAVLRAQATGANPHDVVAVKLTRGADTVRLDLAPQCAGLRAISRGLSHNFSQRPLTTSARLLPV